MSFTLKWGEGVRLLSFVAEDDFYAIGLFSRLHDILISTGSSRR